jgi:hypothetical protein
MFIIVLVLITVFVLRHADPTNVNKLYYSYKNYYFAPLSVEVSMATISVPLTHTRNDDWHKNPIT